MKVYTRKIETTMTYVELDGLVVSYDSYYYKGVMFTKFVKEFENATNTL